MTAEAAVKKDAPAKVAPAPAKKAARPSKLPWLIVIVLLLGGGAGGAWYALKPTEAPANANAAAAAAPEAASQSHAAAIYYKFDPPFVVNFGGEGSTRYLQVTVEAMSRDAGILEVLKNNEPAVR